MGVANVGVVTASLSKFLGSVEFFFAFSPEDLNPVIFHLTLSAVIFFFFFFYGVCVLGLGVFLLFCFDFNIEESKTPMVRRK